MQTENQSSVRTQLWLKMCLASRFVFMRKMIEIYQNEPYTLYTLLDKSGWIKWAESNAWIKGEWISEQGKKRGDPGQI